MKVSKRQLKRIIKEEKVKILKEQGGGGDLTPEQEAKAMEIITASFEMLENDLYENGIDVFGNLKSDLYSHIWKNNLGDIKKLIGCVKIKN